MIRLDEAVGIGAINALGKTRWGSRLTSRVGVVGRDGSQAGGGAGVGGATGAGGARGAGGCDRRAS